MGVCKKVLSLFFSAITLILSNVLILVPINGILDGSEVAVPDDEDFDMDALSIDSCSVSALQASCFFSDMEKSSNTDLDNFFSPKCSCLLRDFSFFKRVCSTDFCFSDKNYIQVLEKN